jgi:hypothetical protein
VRYGAAKRRPLDKHGSCCDRHRDTDDLGGKRASRAQASVGADRVLEILDEIGLQRRAGQVGEIRRKARIALHNSLPLTPPPAPSATGSC